MEFIKPYLPEKEIKLCLDFFEKEESKERILDFIKKTIDLCEFQFNLMKSTYELRNEISLLEHEKTEDELATSKNKSNFKQREEIKVAKLMIAIEKSIGYFLNEEQRKKLTLSLTEVVKDFE